MGPRLSISLCALMLCCSSLAQQMATVEQVMAMIGGIFDEELEAADILLLEERISDLLERPIALNRCDADMLESTLVLDAEEIGGILAYLDGHGPMLSIYELTAVPGMSIMKAKLLSYLCTTGEAAVAKRNQLRYSAFSSLLLPLDSTLDATASPLKLRAKFGIDHADWHLDILLENDRDEDLFAGINPYGFDHMNLSLGRQGQGTLRHMAIGSFHLRFGNALLLGTPYQVNATAGQRSLNSLMGVSAGSLSAENAGFRGACVSLGRGKASALLFASSLRRDARSEDLETVFTSNTGYHDSPSTKAQKGAVRLSSTGLILSYRWPSLEVAGLASAWMAGRPRADSLPLPEVPGGLFAGSLRYSSRQVLLAVEGCRDNRGAAAIGIRGRYRFRDQLQAELDLVERNGPALDWYPLLGRSVLRYRRQAYLGIRARTGDDWELATGAQLTWKESGFDGIHPPASTLSLQLRRSRDAASLRLSWKQEQGILGASLRIPKEPLPGLRTTLLLAMAQDSRLPSTPSALLSFELTYRKPAFMVRVQYLEVRVPEGSPAVYAWASGIPGDAYTMGFFGSGRMLGLSLRVGRKPPVNVGIRIRSDGLTRYDEESMSLRPTPMPLTISLSSSGQRTIQNASN